MGASPCVALTNNVHMDCYFALGLNRMCRSPK